ncbi:hypothetical protein [Streptantibioticus ferralitis]|uniref:Uncharacterized protein n=1 Tax=Streptantibioticus ferralitis TaxID=236510 RepID=A0ABT5Z3F2_9ACTN|nr:hypothetical protein [Streptantibioticus ferralitis]MDF2258333.1 hypothetical protein [Streptantibioticus ferralitis]
MDLQPERFEQLAAQLVRHLRQVDRSDRQAAQQVGVRSLLHLIFEPGELLLQTDAVLAQLGPTLVDVADELLVRLLHQLQVSDEALALGVVLCDGPMQGGDALRPFLSLDRVKGLEVGVE